MSGDIKKVEWKDEYNIDVPEIDAQHKKLVAIINKLYDLLTLGDVKDSSKISEIMDELMEYTKYHFEFEEKSYFRKYGYANSDLHVMQHDNFINEVQRKIDKEKTGCTEKSLEIFYEYLISWLLNHIARADKAWATIIKPKLQ